MYEVQEAHWATPNGNPARFRFRADSSDWNTINSCLGIHDEYGLKGRQISQALDIGGYLGSVGVTIAIDNPGARVVVVEPVPWNAQLIAENAALNGVADRVTVFHGAAGPAGISTTEIRYGYTGDTNLEVHAFVGNSSLSYDTGGDFPHEKMDVETLGLAEVLDRFDLEPDYTKIDCEGGEWTFLDTPAVSRLAYIVGEVHAVRGHKGKDILDLLGATHDVTLDGDAEATCAFVAVRR